MTDGEACGALMLKQQEEALRGDVRRNPFLRCYLFHCHETKKAARVCCRRRRRWMCGLWACVVFVLCRVLCASLRGG